MTTYDVELRQTLGGILRTGRYLCVGHVPVACRQMMTQIHELCGTEPGGGGAPELLGLAVYRDTSPVDPSLPVLVLDRPRAGSFVDDTLNLPGLVAHLSADELEVVDAWDPDGRAQVMVLPLMSDDPIAGRATFGGRPAAWAAVEDKLEVVALWDR
ncbi:MAG: hypothetical protein OER95_19090, partial [Acidimicrobiia bacterium]|nr:hypothetical protein [Acidimicrobiia bacterium]